MKAFNEWVLVTELFCLGVALLNYNRAGRQGRMSGAMAAYIIWALLAISVAVDVCLMLVCFLRWLF